MSTPPDTEQVRLLTDRPNEKQVVSRAWPLLRRHRALISAALAAALLSSGAGVLTTAIIGRAADAANERNGDLLLRWLAVLAVLALADAALIYVSKVLLVRAGERVVRTLRDTAVQQLSTAPLRFLESHRTGELLRRVTGEIADLSRFVATDLPRLVAVVATLAFTLVMLVIYSWLLTLVVVVLFLPGALWVMRWFTRDAAPAFAREASTEAHMSATLTESIPAAEELRLGGGEPLWTQRFRRESEDVIAAARRVVGVENRIVGVALVHGVALSALLLLSTVLLDRGSITVGVLVVFVLASRNLFSGFDDLTESVGDVRSAKTGFSRVLDLIEATRDDETVSGPDDLPSRGALVVDNLTFSYGDGARCLEDFSETFEPGARAAIVGETGSGKTTLGKLLAGLYRPQKGSIRYCGVDVFDIAPAVLRRRIVLVPQEVHLVDGTIAHNVSMVPAETSRAQIESAVRTLGLQDWVATLPDGLDTDLESTGLSAGEKQLIALVRVALTDPAVLILDEATADIDPVTAERVEKALAELSRDRTVVAIAHRAASIERFERIVELSVLEPIAAVRS